MNKYLKVSIVSLGLINLPAYAGPEAGTSKTHKDVAGLGVGAIIGGLIAGPPGAIIGAAGGAWYGDRQEKKDEQLAVLETRLLEKQTELAQLQGEFTDQEYRHGMKMLQVKADQRSSELDKLSQGVSLSVFFRTDSASMDPDVIPRIERLAQYLQAFPEIQLHLEAHADQRGASAYNERLSQQRAASVRQALIQAGVPEKRIYSHAHGESMAQSSAGDLEGYVFDRRVNIELSLDRQSYAVQ
ncbi:MAG: OmpA-like protein [Gammaproteobacteria bacterium]|nr:OmpA-like protein [Gammaproteobacteria bacterium]